MRNQELSNQELSVVGEMHLQQLSPGRQWWLLHASQAAQ